MIFQRERKRKKEKKGERQGWDGERDFAECSECQGGPFLACLALLVLTKCLGSRHLGWGLCWQSGGDDEGMGAEVREIRWLIRIISFSCNQDGQPGIQSLSTCFLSASDGLSPIQCFGGLVTSKSLCGGERERHRVIEPGVDQINTGQ